MLSRLLRRRLELAPTNVDAAWIDGDDWRDWDPPRNFVRGESHYRPALRKLTGTPRDAGYLIPVCVNFVREPENPHDHNAFRAEVDGLTVGHLGREFAAQLAPVADRAGCSRFTVCGVLRGGSTEARDVGVHVWLERRLTPGIGITIRGATGLVNWPPRPSEGVECTADEAHR